VSGRLGFVLLGPRRRPGYSSYIPAPEIGLVLSDVILLLSVAYSSVRDFVAGAETRAPLMDDDCSDG